MLVICKKESGSGSNNNRLPSTIELKVTKSKQDGKLGTSEIVAIVILSLIFSAMVIGGIIACCKRKQEKIEEEKILKIERL